jgi:hypothetical protein
LDTGIDAVTDSTVDFGADTAIDATCSWQLAPQVTYTTDPNPYGVWMADFNGDAKLDVAINWSPPLIANDRQLDLFSNEGNGVFAPKNSYGLWPMAVGDFSGDHVADLVVQASVAWPPWLGIAINDGHGNFGTPTTFYADTNNFIDAAIGDFNGDGHPDLAVLENDGSTNVKILLSAPNGGFAPVVTYAVGNRPLSSVVADFNGDGHLDLAVVNLGGTVSVLVNVGEGTFQPQVTVASGGVQPSGLAVGDLNGDGKLDLAIANNMAPATSNMTSGNVAVLFGNGDGTFAAPVTYGGDVDSWFSGIAIGDFNGDGYPDLAAPDGGAIVGNIVTSVLRVYLNDGHGDFGTQVTYAMGALAIGEVPEGIVVGDVNGDGHPDVVVTGTPSTPSQNDGTLSVYLSQCE